MGSTGELKAFNRAFKEARGADPSIRYIDYLEARKDSGDVGEGPDSPQVGFSFS
jgi:hypothetical protein